MNKNLVLIATISMFAIFAIALVSAVDWSWLTGKATTDSSDTNPFYGPYRAYDGRTLNLDINGEKHTVDIIDINPSVVTLQVDGTYPTSIEVGTSAIVGPVELKVIKISATSSIFTKSYVTLSARKAEEKVKCTDSDGGINANTYGWVDFRPGNVTLDVCALVSSYDSDGTPGGWEGVNSCSGKDCYIQEAYCKTDDKGNFIDADATQMIKCTNGCANGACIDSSSTTDLNEISRGVVKNIAKCSVVRIASSDRTCNSICQEKGSLCLFGMVHLSMSKSPDIVSLDGLVDCHEGTPGEYISTNSDYEMQGYSTDIDTECLCC